MLLYMAKGTSLAQNCSINAGLSTTICLSDTMKLFGTRSGLFSANATSRWTQLSGPVNVTINRPDSLITTVSGYTAGTYVFKLNNKCQDGVYSEDTISIKVSPVTVANAGRDTILCPSAIYYLNANKPMNGETGIWTTIFGSGITVNSPGNPNSSISLQATLSGITKLRWTITNSNGCTSYDDVEITNCGGVMPVNAGQDQSLDNCYSTTTCTKLSATNGGTGLGGQIGIWSFISGPSVPLISSPNNSSTNVCQLNQGTYIFRYTVSGPCATGYDEVSVVVPPAGQGMSYVSSGRPTGICGIDFVTLTGTNPTYSNEVVKWTQIYGPMTTTIHTPNNPSTLVTGLTTPGHYIFNYNVTNTASGCSVNSTVRIIVYKTGTVYGGPDQVLPCNVTEATIPTDTTGFGNVNYRIINGPAGAFNYPTDYSDKNTIKGLNYPGTYRVQINYQFSPECPSVNDYVDITVSRTATGANAGSHQNFACAATSTQLAGNNPVLTGLGSGRWSQISGPNNATLVNPENYICDITGTVPGRYVFRWTITGGNNCPSNHDDITVITPGSSVTKANAGTDKFVCSNSPLFLEGNIYRPDETASWTVFPSNITFVHSNTEPTPLINGLQPNTSYTFVYTITNSCGTSSSDSVNITTGSSTGPSAANAGPDQCLPENSAVIYLNGNHPASGTGRWEQIAGTPVIITNPLVYNTTITGAQNGTYKFTWTISVDNCSNNTTDTVIITIAGNTTVSDAGTDITKCGNSVTLNANTPLVGTGYWTQISGDGAALISSLNNPNTNVSGLITGEYIFRWTIENGVCSSNSDDIKVLISTPPSIANAGSDINVCVNNATTVTLNASTPTTGTGQWVWVTGPTLSPNIANSTSPVTNVTGLYSGAHTFRWIVKGGPGCPQTADDLIVNVSIPSSAGPDKSLCNITATTLKGNEGSYGKWTQVSGPNATILQIPAGNPIANISGLQAGSTYTFRYTIPAFAGCPASFDDVIVTNGSSTLIPDAGKDESYCNATSFQLNGNKPGPGESGTWSVESGPSGAIFLPNANTPNAVLSGVSAGIYILKWTISNGSCTNSDLKRIDNYISPTKANAGADDTLCYTNTISLNANVPTAGIGKWSLISGPNTPVIDAPNNPLSRIIGVVPGTYKFSWTVSNYTCDPSVDEVQVTILNNVNTAYAGSDINTCLNSVVLNGNMPATGNLCKWSQISGPNTAKFSSDESARSTISNLKPGCYKFLWKIYNARCYNTDTVEVKVNNSVKVEAGNDITICNTTSSIPLSGASVSGFTNEGYWTIISGEGALSTENLTDMPGSVIFTPAPGYLGAVVLRLSANDNCYTVTDDIIINIKAAGKNMEAENDTTRTAPNTSIYIDVLKNDKTMGSNVLTLCNNSIAVRPAHGTATVNNDGTILYTPVTGYTGIDSFNYKLCNVAANIDSTKALCVTEGNDNAWVYITIEGCTIPNSFSPDGDGVNDFFEIPCAQGVSKINIFNRAGIEVYKNDAYNNEWDGNYNGSPLPDGTYFYMLKYSTDTVNKLSKDGFITLRR